MPFDTKYIFVVTMDVDPGKEDVFNEVYDDDHIAELLKVPGVVSVSRGMKRAAELFIDGNLVPVGDDAPTYLAIYELESPDVIKSEAWQAAVDEGRWSGEVRPFTSNRHHVMHEVIATQP